MNLYFILYFSLLCLATASAKGASANSPLKHPFDPTVTYKFDDRRPIPEYVYEDEIIPEDDEEEMAMPHNKLMDDIWGMKGPATHK